MNTSGQSKMGIWAFVVSLVVGVVFLSLRPSVRTFAEAEADEISGVPGLGL